MNAMQESIRRTGFLLLVAVTLELSSERAPANWPAWRGPSANGSTLTGNYPTSWSGEGISWKAALPGKGGSSPIVWQNRICLTTPAEGQDVVLALDFSGKELWRRALGPESPPKHRTLGSSCNSSPVTDGQGLFVYFRSGHFAALEFDGTVRWKINIHERFGPEKLFWDQGSSPVVTDQHVVLSRLHEGESWIAGFDKKTGELRWQQKRNYPVPTENDNGYATPLSFDHDGRKALLVWGADHLTAHAASEGTLLWSCGGFNPDGTDYWPAIASPVIHGKIAVVPVGRDDRSGQARVHGIRIDGHGDVTAKHRVWKREDLGVFVPSLAEYKGRVFLLRHRGEVVCLDPATGKTIWSEALPRGGASFYASPVIANGLLYAAREDGVVFVARIADKFELLSENPMGERVVASPVVSNDRLLIRGDKNLFCIGAKEP
ncbi:MAG: PQQ-binding-like beta-propeller repeat protein [Verrucomicrobiales bacterium]|nr:PQQ-binding-like beta-propeller repeat protein [Verrucomicrobiales bacterium]